MNNRNLSRHPVTVNVRLHYASVAFLGVYRLPFTTATHKYSAQTEYSQAVTKLATVEMVI